MTSPTREHGEAAEAPPFNGGYRDRSYSCSGPSATNKATAAAAITSKAHSHDHRNHGPNRPRSKSCDVHKRKHPSSYKRENSGHRSPAYYHHHHPQGRASPKVANQQLHGHLWIRPVPVKVDGRQHQSPVTPAQELANDYKMDVTSEFSKDVKKYYFAPLSPNRQLASSPTMLYDDEMMLFDDSVQPDSSSRNEAHNIAFGESGKPIMPRSRQYCPASAT